MEYRYPTRTASLVLRHRFPAIELPRIARRIAKLVSPRPSWSTALSPRHSDASSLAAVRWLHTHGVDEEWFPCDCGCATIPANGEHTRSSMDEAAALGFLSVVEYLHQHSRIGWTSNAIEEAASRGHVHVVEFLLANCEVDDVDVALIGAAAQGHLPVVQRLVSVGSPMLYGALHRSIFFGHHEVTAFLCDLYRQSEQPLPGSIMEWALKAGHVALVQWLYHDMGFRWGYGGLAPAVRSRDYATIQFVLDHHGRRDHYCYILDEVASDMALLRFLDERVRGLIASQTAMNMAARFGQLDAVRFLHEHRREGCTAAAMDDAAARGHLAVVRFLHEYRTEGCTTRAMDLAAAGGHLNVVQFLHEHRREGCTTDAMDGAAANGHLDVVTYLHESRTEGCTPRAMHGAAVRGHVEVVQYLHEYRSEGWRRSRPGGDDGDDDGDVATKQLVIARGHLNVLKFLVERGLVVLDPSDLWRRSEKNEAEIRAHVYERCVADVAESTRRSVLSEAFAVMARDGQLSQIQWLDSKRDARDEAYHSSAMDEAASHGHLAIVEYLHRHGGHTGCTTKAMDEAARRGHLEIVQFLHTHRHEGCTTDAMDGAATNGFLTVVQYLHTHRTEGCTTAAMDGAASGGHLAVVRFLDLHRSEGCTNAAIQRAADAVHTNVVLFLHEQRGEGCLAALWPESMTCSAPKVTRRYRSYLLGLAKSCRCRGCAGSRKAAAKSSLRGATASGSEDSAAVETDARAA